VLYEHHRSVFDYERFDDGVLSVCDQPKVFGEFGVGLLQRQRVALALAILGQ
jgi:hypothetical protein